MLRRRGAAAVAALVALAGMALASPVLASPVLASPVLASPVLPHVSAAAGRTMAVAPDLGMPGLAVRFEGANVPHDLTYRVAFDVTTSDKAPVCSGSTGRSTRWRCTGRIPRRFGALGLHTVEMDATPRSGRGGFVELATFLVTDLGVTMSAPATTAPGDTVQFKVTASNGNAVVAHGVRLLDAVPAGLRVTRVTAPCSERNGVVRCGPLRMGVRTSRSFTITAIVTASRPTHLFDRVSISGSPDPLRRNDSVRVELTVT